MRENISESQTNPLLVESSLPFGAPQFDIIQLCHLKEFAIEEATRFRDAIRSITANPEVPTFANTVVPFEEALARYDDASCIYSMYMSTLMCPELQRIDTETFAEWEPIISETRFNDAYFSRLKSVYTNRDTMHLDSEEKRLLEKMYFDMSQSGLSLNADERRRLSDIGNRLAELSWKFERNKTNARSTWSMNLTNEEDLAGLPDMLIKRAHQKAQKAGLEGWLFGLADSGQFMAYSEHRELREKMSKASAAICTSGENDNSAIIKEIANLRMEQAHLLGYKSFADMRLNNSMVKSAEKVNGYLTHLAESLKESAKKELERVSHYASKNGFDGDKFEFCDLAFWFRRLNLEENKYNPRRIQEYLQVNNTLNSVFHLAERLYGISIKEVDNLPVYSKDVKVFEASDYDGTHLGLLYLDLYQRPGKTPGARVQNLRMQRFTNGRDIRPILLMSLDLTPKQEGLPDLMSFPDLKTLLHEFGHSLHILFSKVRFASLSGTNVSRDFVELPSELMENWAYEPELLRETCRHYISGEQIPDDIIETIKNDRTFMRVDSNLTSVKLSLLDIAWNSLDKPLDISVDAFEESVLSEYQTSMSSQSKRSYTFSHSFSGGYAANYYSYVWSKVLSTDAFKLFKMNGIYSKETASLFRECILSKGNTDDASILYKKFAGHDPNPDNILEELGIKYDG